MEHLFDIQSKLRANKDNAMTNMQAQALQQRMQAVPNSGPVKKQVDDARKNQKLLRDASNPAASQQSEEPPKGVATREACPCCRHYGRLCLQRYPGVGQVKSSPQHYHPGINKKQNDPILKQSLESCPQSVNEASTVQPLIHTPEGIDNVLKSAQAKRSFENICLDGWTISFKEFQPHRGKRSKGQSDAVSQEKISSSGQLENDNSCPHPNTSSGSLNLQGVKLAQPLILSTQELNTSSLVAHPRILEVNPVPKGKEDCPIMEPCCNSRKLGYHAKRCLEKQMIDAAREEYHKHDGMDPQDSQCPQDHAATKPKVRDPLKARVNCVHIEQARRTTTLLLGKVQLNNTVATVLFDSKTTHSFIATKFVKENYFDDQVRSRRMLAQIQGKEVLPKYWCQNLKVRIMDTEFALNATIIDMEGIDLILGRDWLDKYKGKMDQHRRVMRLICKSRSKVEFKGWKVESP